MRKREPADRAIRATIVPLKVASELTSLRIGTAAYEVALVDGWKGPAVLPAGTRSITELWDAIAKCPCLQLNWTLFKSRLSHAGTSEVQCRCGAHFLSAVLIHHGWSLIVLGRESLLAAGSSLDRDTIHRLVRLLAELDKGKIGEPVPHDPRGGGGTAGPAELGIPLWWAGKPN